jgi:hypothetical protein
MPEIMVKAASNSLYNCRGSLRKIVVIFLIALAFVVQIRQGFGKLHPFETSSTTTATTTNNAVVKASTIIIDSTVSPSLSPYDAPSRSHSAELQFADGQIKGAAMMLVSKPWTQSRVGRFCYFNKSLDDLSRNWYPTNRYPLILQDPDGWSQQEITDIRQRWPQLEIYFSNVNHSFHVAYPAVMEDHEKPIQSLGYKKMCAFKTYGFLDAPFVSQLDYVFFSDDDSCITEPIRYDVFEKMRHHNIAYSYKQLFLDPLRVVVGLANFVQEYERQHHLQAANPALEAPMQGDEKGDIWAFFTNLEWLNLNEFRRTDVMDFHRAIQGSEMIFHGRWGDAPLRFVLAYLFFTNTQIMQLCSEYVHSTWRASKWFCTDDLQTPVIEDAVLLQLNRCKGAKYACD